jgi:hypothetical protein
MSLETFLTNLIAAIENDIPTIEAALSDLEPLVGIGLGLAGAIVDASDPALTPVVTPLVALAQSKLAAAQAAVTAAGTNVLSATTAVAALNTAAVQLINAAAPGITAIANVNLGSNSPPA